MSVGFPNISDTSIDSFGTENAGSEVHINDVLKSVQETIAPVWPLKDYVAVNPYGGMSGETFLEAREYLRGVSDCEMFMPLDYYGDRLRQGAFGLPEIEDAIDEMVEDQVSGAETLCANAIFKILSEGKEIAQEIQVSNGSSVRPISKTYDDRFGTNWSEMICEEISKTCAAHYDEGQARWASPWRHLPLYQAWQIIASQDRRIEILGLGELREFVAHLPATPQHAIKSLLATAEVPEAQWKDYLLSLSLSIPGWSAWTKYRTAESEKQGEDSFDFLGLLAIRLAYDVALCVHFSFPFQLELARGEEEHDEIDPDSSEALMRLAILRANEIGLRSRLLVNLNHQPNSDSNESTIEDCAATRKLAQMVFCIDVRSERIRRNLEAVSGEIDTIGFAGFFGLPFKYVRIGEQQATNQLPVLLEPQFTVYQDVRSDELLPSSDDAKQRRGRIRALRQAWKRFQTSALSCFAYVETTGIFYVGVLLKKVLGYGSSSAEYDGVSETDRERLGPSLRSLQDQGLTTTRQVDIAEAVLTNMGLTKDFARLVVLCGHASHTENNPLQASLDCGACGGHSGEANARFAAMLLNQPHVRESLVGRGIEIPHDTHFLAGLHNTTTDQIDFFDLDLLPESHQFDVEILKGHTKIAGISTRSERLPLLPGDGQQSLVGRSTDWSEVRPEWGLSGNAAFIVGRRELSKHFDLQGRSFLHSYDHQRDESGKVLELIMTAPMVVANWINMQYYASTVDQDHFGSGEKTIHNVVGKFGIFSGNGGDLRTGLPWQSIHDGANYQHDPVRLLSVIEAPRESINRILAEHENVRDLVSNGWVQLVALDDGACYRYSGKQTWELLEVQPSENKTWLKTARLSEVVAS